MRRHYANYFKGLPDFKPYRMRLVAEPDINNIYSILEEVAEKFANYDARNVMA